LIALRTLTSAMSIRCCHRSFGSHLNANDRVSLSVVSHEPLGHSPPAFLFLSSTISMSGEDMNPPTFTSRGRREFGLDPFWVVPAHSPAASGCVKERCAVEQRGAPSVIGVI